MTKKLKITAGCRARTNEAYERVISRTPREMTVLRPSKTIDGAWHCRWDGVEPEQVIHQSFLEVVQ
jgi:hypothetical protein